MGEKPRYFNRDISWLSFNYRVLEEAKDLSLPLYERIKFLAIYDSNMDEFYRVRVATYRSLLDLPSSNKQRQKYDPEKTLRQINLIAEQQLKEFYNIAYHSIIPELAANKIILHMLDTPLTPDQKGFVDEFFYREVLPHIQPTLLAKGRVLTFLQDNMVYLVVRLFLKTARKRSAVVNRRQHHAIIRVPRHHVSRFIKLPADDGKHHIIFLDDVIRQNLSVLFPGYEIDSCYSIKLSRDADMQIEDEFEGDLVEKIRVSLTKRKTGRPCRFMYDSAMPKDLLNLLTQVFNLSDDDLMPASAYHNLIDFFGLPNPLSPKLELEKLRHLPVKSLDAYTSLFEAIKNRDWLFYFPFQTYDYVIKFFHQAATDPMVKEIKTTQYRVASNSSIVSALISAARNGKKVTVFVEFKARFDEELNLQFAEKMQKAGVRIIPSLPGLKVHAKVGLVIRKSSRAQKVRGYAYLSTGNFNEKTAKLYADYGLFTSDDTLIDELNKLFLYLEDTTRKVSFKHILVAQFNMVPTILEMIDREIKHASEGKKGYMMIKVNGMESQPIIDKLYEASQAGVRIDLIVRGICCLIPDQSYSKNIRITRIVDRFLEHARVWVFYNNGQNNTYIASADWMSRNLFRRIETGIPIINQDLKQEILDVLKIQLADNVKARHIDDNLNNRTIASEGLAKIRSQMATYEYYKMVSESDGNNAFPESVLAKNIQLSQKKPKFK